MRRIIGFICISFLLIASSQAMTKNRVLFIDSYHEGYGWSDGVTEGVKNILGNKVELKIIRMDTKRNTDEQFKTQAAMKAKSVIESFRPDVVIASDDNASKYLIAPYYRGKNLPVVFCGVNWDASVYGFPATNVTGMIEVTPVHNLIELLQKISPAVKTGLLGPDTLTAQREVTNQRSILGVQVTEYLAKDFNDYKNGFKELQINSDIVILLSDGGLYDDKEAELITFLENNTKKPTGSFYDFMAEKTIFTYAKDPLEQGEWAATAALEIIGGKSPANIPVVKNKKGVLMINVRMAKAAGIKIPVEIIKSAHKIIE